MFYAVIVPLPNPAAPVDPGYGRPGWSPADPGYGKPSWSPVDPGYGRPDIGAGHPAHPLPPEGQPGSPSHPIATLPVGPDNTLPDHSVKIFVYVPGYGIVGPIALPPPAQPKA